MGEVDIVSGVDCRSSLLGTGFKTGNLVDSRVVAHHHAVKSEVVAQNVLKDLAVGHAVGAFIGMVTRHQRLAAFKSYHSFVGQENLLHQLLLIGITASAVAEVVLGACTHALFEVALLQTPYKSGAHYGR